MMMKAITQTKYKISHLGILSTGIFPTTLACSCFFSFLSKFIVDLAIAKLHNYGKDKDKQMEKEALQLWLQCFCSEPRRLMRCRRTATRQ